MGGYEGFTYYWIEINDGIDFEFRTTYKEITKYYSISEPCLPNWQCRQPLDGYETDINNCGESDRYNEDCIDLCEGVNCEDICVDTDLWYQKCNPSTGECVLDRIHFNNHESCGGGPITVCRKGCAIDGSYDYYTGNLIDGECESIENSELCGYVPPDEDNIMKYLVFGGLGLIGYMKLMNDKK